MDDIVPEATPTPPPPTRPPWWQRLTFSTRAKVATASLLFLALGWVLVIVYQYETTKKPVAELPAVPGGAGIAIALAKQAPSYVQEIYGPANAALSNPLGVAVSPSGDRVYITEGTGERTTRVFNRQGTQVGRLAPPATEPSGRLPMYATVDPAGNVYISDRLRAVIDIYSPDGAYKGIYQPASDPPAAPMALTFDAAGNFYVTDAPEGHHRLLVFDAAGTPKLAIGREGAAPGEFSFPNGVIVDKKGSIYVADSNNGRVQIFDQAGQLLETIGRGGKGNLSIPRGLAIDQVGRFFIVDTTAQMVDVWDVTGKEPKHLYTIGSYGVGRGEFSYPNGIALDTTGRLYVTDRMNGRVNVWSY